MIVSLTWWDEARRVLKQYMCEDLVKLILSYLEEKEEFLNWFTPHLTPCEMGNCYIHSECIRGRCVLSSSELRKRNC